jgi:hypothetical protein
LLGTVFDSFHGFTRLGKASPPFSCLFPLAYNFAELWSWRANRTPGRNELQSAYFVLIRRIPGILGVDNQRQRERFLACRKIVLFAAILCRNGNRLNHKFAGFRNL